MFLFILHILSHQIKTITWPTVILYEVPYILPETSSEWGLFVFVLFHIKFLFNHARRVVVVVMRTRSLHRATPPTILKATAPVPTLHSGLPVDVFYRCVVVVLIIKYNFIIYNLCTELFTLNTDCPATRVHASHRSLAPTAPTTHGIQNKL